MSLRTRISTLDKGKQRVIKALLYKNGCADEDVQMFMESGTLKDIEDVVDLREIFR